MTTDAEIIEAMARAAFERQQRRLLAKYEWIPCASWDSSPEVHEEFLAEAREHHAICAPAIRAQAMEEAAKVAERFLIYVTVCNPGAVADAIRTAALAPPAVAEKGSNVVLGPSDHYHNPVGWLRGIIGSLERIGQCTLGYRSDLTNAKDALAALAPPAVAEKGERADD